MKFSAVILAGGQSRRMGTDKAFLDWKGRPLLARQIETVLALKPDELFISGRAGADYGGFDFPVLHDSFPGSGPLSGIERAFQVAHSPMLLVLAVDMPRMTDHALERLAQQCTQTRGIVPVSDERIQPLAAFYPKAAHRIALELLGAGIAPATQFAELCLESRIVEMHHVSKRDAIHFANWNSPGDLPTHMTKICPKSKPASPTSAIVASRTSKACNREAKANENTPLCPSQEDCWKERDRDRVSKAG